MAKLTLETAKKMYLEGGAGKQFALDNFSEEKLKKNELPKSWGDLPVKSGGTYFVTSELDIEKTSGSRDRNWHKYTYASEEQAEAAIAIAQLTQLMKAYNGEWVADWTSYNTKWCVVFQNNKFKVDTWIHYSQFIAFKSQDIAEEFLKNFRDLIETAKPLL